MQYAYLITRTDPTDDRDEDRRAMSRGTQQLGDNQPLPRTAPANAQHIDG